MYQLQCFVMESNKILSNTRDEACPFFVYTVILDFVFTCMPIITVPKYAVFVLFTLVFDCYRWVRLTS